MLSLDAIFTGLSMGRFPFRTMHKLLLLVLVLVLALLAATLGFAQDPNYRLDKMMGTPIYAPRDVAVDRTGNAYLLDGGGVTKLDSTGRCDAGFSETLAGRAPTPGRWASTGRATSTCAATMNRAPPALLCASTAPLATCSCSLVRWARVRASFKKCTACA